MIEPTPINIVRILALCGMLFCWGMSTEVSDRTREIAKVLWLALIAFIWIVDLVTGGWN